MKVAIILVGIAVMCGCSREDSAKAHEDAAKVRQESHELAQQAETETEKASRELDRGLNKTRDKVRQALDDTDEPSKRAPDRDKR